MGTSQMLNNALMQHGPLPLHLTGQCRVIATYSLASFLLNELKCADFSEVLTTPPHYMIEIVLSW